MSQSYSTYFNSSGKKIHTLPKCGLVTIQFARHILCSINFWCGFNQLPRCVFYTNAVLKSCTFYTGSIVALLYLIFKLQYLMNLQIPIASSLYYTTTVIRRPEFWGPNFYSLFLKVYISSVS